jgi:hypothetical protein
LTLLSLYVVITQVIIAQGDTITDESGFYCITTGTVGVFVDGVLLEEMGVNEVGS